MPSTFLDQVKSTLDSFAFIDEFHPFVKLQSQTKSPILFLVSLLVFSITIYDTLTFFNCLILILGAFCTFLLSDQRSILPLNSPLLKISAMLLTWLFLLYSIPQLSLIAPNFLLIIPLLVFYFTKDARIVFLTFSIQLFLHNFFVEPKFIEVLYHSAFYHDFFSSFKLFSFVALCIPICLLNQQNTKDSEPNTTTIPSKLKEYETTIAELKDALQSKDHLLHLHEDTLLTFAHECRNPLHGVQSNLELAEAMLNDKGIRHTLDLDKIEGFVHNSRICGEFLLQYLNNILDAGKVESNTIDINLAPTDFKLLLEKVWAICCENIKRKNVLGSLKLQMDVPPYLLIDSHRIIQILVNLINNAVKFTSKGTISITVEWKRLEDFSHVSTNKNIKSRNLKHLPTFDSACFDNDIKGAEEEPEPVVTHSKTLSVGNPKKILKNEFFSLDLHQTKFERIPPLLKRPQNSQKGLLIIEVKDTGCGMSREDLSKLFLKFSQVNPDPSKRKMGTGLGLWLCQQIAQKMSGTIEAESVLGSGSLFRVKIPTEISESPLQRSFKNIPYGTVPNSQRIDKAIASQKKVKAIVVDDIVYNREVHKLLLKKCEVEIVTEATTGKEAVEQFKKYAGGLDLVVLDLEMPEMGGLEACRQIRLYERAQNLKSSYIVVISSGAHGEEIEKISDSERNILYDYYVKKPCPLSEFQKISSEAFVKSMSRLFSTFSPQPPVKIKKKVLIVDDDVFSLDIARNFFGNAQIEYHCAMSGDDGIQTLKEYLDEIGCIILDFEMPDMDGKEVLIKIRAFLETQKIKELPVYCASGNTSQQFVQEMKSAGFKDVYAKPIPWAKLIMAVKRELNNSL